MASTYQVLRSPRGQYVSVKVGFCWPAFFFGPFWALYHRLWSIGARLLIIHVSLTVLDKLVVRTSDSPAVLLAMAVTCFVYIFVCGRFGNAWRTGNLLRRGFTPIASAQSTNSEGSRAAALSEG